MAQRIFVVEDDRFMRDAVDLILSQAGYHFTGVGSGEEALDLVSRSMPDLILLDIGLPGIGGLKVLSALRRRGVVVPILMMTANANPSTVRDVMEMGGSGYVLKPFNPRELVQRVGAALAPAGLKRTVRALRVA